MGYSVARQDNGCPKSYHRSCSPSVTQSMGMEVIGMPQPHRRMPLSMLRPRRRFLGVGSRAPEVQMEGTDEPYAWQARYAPLRVAYVGGTT